MKKILTFKKIKRFGLIAGFSLVVLSITIFTFNSPYEAELRFVEHSSKKDVLGSVVPASCETLRDSARTDESNHFTECTCSYLYGDQAKYPGYYSPTKAAATNWPACDNVSVPVPGCTDPGANNYNPSATINNGSCTYNPSLPTVNFNLE